MCTTSAFVLLLWQLLISSVCTHPLGLLPFLCEQARAAELDQHVLQLQARIRELHALTVGDKLGEDKIRLMLDKDELSAHVSNMHKHSLPASV